MSLKNFIFHEQAGKGFLINGDESSGVGALPGETGIQPIDHVLKRDQIKELYGQSHKASGHRDQ